MIAKLSGLIGKASAPFLAKAAIGAGAVIVTLLAGLGITFKLLLDSQNDLGACSQSRVNAVQQAENNKAVAVNLSDRLADEVNARALDREAQAEAQARWENRVERLRDRADRERKLREEIYDQEPTCDAMRDTLVCGPIDRRLRESRASAGAGRGNG